MATEKTIFANVTTEVVGNDETTNETTNTTNAQGTNKNAVKYDMGFNGSEEIVWQPEAFEAFGKTTRMSSAELSKKIYAYFKQTFHELKGCNLTYNGQINVELFFERNTEPLPDGKIMNLVSLTDPVGSNANLFDRMQVTQNRTLGKVYKLNNETKLLLSKFMYGGKNANTPNAKTWSDANVVTQLSIPVNDVFHRNYNTDRILLRVTNLNIAYILQEIYGSKIITKTEANETSDINHRSTAHYQARFIKGMPDGSFIMNIEQFDTKAVESIFMKENPIPQQYLGIQMYNV